MKRTSVKKSNVEEETNKDNTTDASLSGVLGAIAQQAATQSVSRMPTDSKEVFSKIGNEIVAKMIATSDALAAKQEVKMSFKNDVLQGTEATLLKDGNKLSVNFITDVDKSEQIILQNRNDLQSLLLEKLHGTEVVIEVSRGKNTNSDTGDGRSRNQYYSDQQNDDDTKE